MDGADAIKYIIENNIEGAIIECGVASGDFEVAWINELKKLGHTRDIYMFDTFAGLTEPSQFDYTCENAKIYKMSSEQVHNEWSSKKVNDKLNNWCYTPLDQVQSRLNALGYPSENLHYIVGDVMETLKDRKNIPEKIAILRLDTDWYESSKVELEEMYDNVVKGGVIIFDDYYHWDGQRRATDDFFKMRGEEYEFVDIKNYKTAAIIKR